MAGQEGRLGDQVAIVTGAAQGMGATIATRLAREGAAVVACDINGEQVAGVVEEIKAAGGRAQSLEVDVTSESDVARMVDTALESCGSVSVLVNNAGILRATRIEEISTEEWDLVLDANLKGTFFCSRAVLAPMKQNGFGRIVNMSSSAGRSVSTLGGAHYTTAKAGVLGLTRAMAKELGSHGITVNAICPGLIDTEMARANCTPERLRAYEESFPIPRLGLPDEVGDLVLFLVADAAYITGASIDINGGDLMM